MSQRIFSICVPCRQHVDHDAMAAIVTCCIGTALWWNRVAPGGTVHYLDRARAHITWARQEMSERCLEVGSEWVLWLDDDAVPPYDLVPRLAAHDKDMIVPLFFKRGHPYDHTLGMIGGTAQKPEIVPADPFPKRLFQVDVAGMHAVLMKGTVLQKMLAQGDWLFHNHRNVGEDYAFFQIAKALGLELWCDSTVEVGHVGTKTITSRDYLAARPPSA